MIYFVNIRNVYIDVYNYEYTDYMEQRNYQVRVNISNLINP